MEEAKAAAVKLRTLIGNLPESQLPSTQFLGETLRMLVELEDYDAVVEIAEVSLSIDENQPDTMYIQAFAQFKLLQTDSAKERTAALRVRFPRLPEELEDALSELERSLR